MTNNHLITGKKGEEIAVNFLINKGFNILEQNYRAPHAEVDIIAKDIDVVCFIEVKTRTSTSKALAKQAVNRKKQKKIIMGAQTYLKSNRLFNVRARFDVIEVMINKNPLINHIQNAFLAG